jgi:hypothetical protein
VALEPGRALAGVAWAALGRNGAAFARRVAAAGAARVAARRRGTGRLAAGARRGRWSLTGEIGNEGAAAGVTQLGVDGR